MLAPSAGAVEYPDCISAEGKTPPTSVLFMTPNNLGAVEYTNCISAEGKIPKQSYGEAPVMLELWGMRSTSSFQGPLWPGVLAPDRVISMGQIELFDICSTELVDNGTVFTFNCANK